MGGDRQHFEKSARELAEHHGECKDSHEPPYDSRERHADTKVLVFAGLGPLEKVGEPAKRVSLTEVEHQGIPFLQTAVNNSTAA